MKNHLFMNCMEETTYESRYTYTHLTLLRSFCIIFIASFAEINHLKSDESCIDSLENGKSSTTLLKVNEKSQKYSR